MTAPAYPPNPVPNPDPLVNPALPPAPSPADPNAPAAPSGPPVPAPAPERTYTAAEVAAISRQLDEVNKAKQAAEKQVEDFLNKDKTDLEQAQDLVKKLQVEQEKREKEVEQLRIRNKFLASNKYSWHDNEAALALLDMTDVKISEFGNVTGLEKAVDELAKNKPFLVKSTEGEGARNNTVKPPVAPSGSQPNGSTGKVVDRARLEQKFPGLRGRSEIPA